MDTLHDTIISDESPSSPAVGLSVGATLRAAREAQGMNVADVAERVKFSVRQVEALEADDILHLPQGTFLRGFIRSYARVLHLDEVALLAAIPVKAEPQLEVADAQSGGEAFPGIESARQKSIYLLAGALAVALVLAVFVWGHSDTPKLEKTMVEDIKLPELIPASAPVIVSQEIVSAVQSAVVPAITIEPKKVSPLVETIKTIPVAPKTTTPRVPPKAVEPVAVAVPVVSVKPGIPLEQLKKRPIHIVFISDVWMEITDRNGEVLLSRTTQAGDDKWVGGMRRGPYQVTIGKAGAVRIYNKGREVDLSQYKQAGLVKLVLE